MTINCFEDLEIWQEARELAKYDFILTKKEDFSKDFKFRDQIIEFQELMNKTKSITNKICKLMAHLKNSASKAPNTNNNRTTLRLRSGTGRTIEQKNNRTTLRHDSYRDAQGPEEQQNKRTLNIEH